MFGIPGKPPVTITPRAAKQIATLMAREKAAGLRIGVKKGGCAGGWNTRWKWPQRPRRWMRSWKMVLRAC